MSPIKTAVVGLNMGAAHAWAYHLSDKAELRWVVDLDEEKAKQFAAEMNCRATADWREALADVDAISFATPHHLHYPMAREALRAGKHVLMEKPLANTEAECLELIETAQARKRRSGDYSVAVAGVWRARIGLEDEGHGGAAKRHRALAGAAKLLRAGAARSDTFIRRQSRQHVARPRSAGRAAQRC